MPDAIASRKKPSTKTRASLSVSGKLYTRLEKWCEKNEVPINAIVELCLARELRIPIEQLHEDVRKYARNLPDVAAE